VRTCTHGGPGGTPRPQPCPHCKADDEILEEKIEAVVRSVVSVVESRAAGPRLDEFRIALLELVR
jgi:glutaredoxin